MVVDIGHDYRSLQWVTRVLSIACVVLFCTNISTALLLWGLFPLKQIQPMLLTVHEKSDQVVHVQPIDINQSGINLLMETLARQYVVWRETIDHQSEEDRWQKLIWFTSDKLYQSFYDLMKPENPDSPLEKFKKDRVTRSVTLLSVTHLAPSAPNVWQVEWVSIDTRDGEEIGRNVWVSTLTATCEEKSMGFDDRYINPIGFTVSHYTLMKKEHASQQKEKTR